MDMKLRATMEVEIDRVGMYLVSLVKKEAHSTISTTSNMVTRMPQTLCIYVKDIN